ncbi:MAG: hypothetical protein M0C28_10705 [Candidatus Moduliflexus flocculans]|nr:hypothetical protein [Candidatus Moduliflexus flocculans]
MMVQAQIWFMILSPDRLPSITTMMVCGIRLTWAMSGAISGALSSVLKTRLRLAGFPVGPVVYYLIMLPAPGSGLFYTPASVTIDKSNNLWVYAGTGDKNDPTASNAGEKMYAIKDLDRTSTYATSMTCRTSTVNSTYDPYSTTKKGRYINMTGGGEKKILAEPVLFEGRIYAATYIPGSGNESLQCGWHGKPIYCGLYYGRG